MLASSAGDAVTDLDRMCSAISLHMQVRYSAYGWGDVMTVLLRPRPRARLPLSRKPTTQCRSCNMLQASCAYSHPLPHVALHHAFPQPHVGYCRVSTHTHLTGHLRQTTSHAYHLILSLERAFGTCPRSCSLRCSCVTTRRWRRSSSAWRRSSRTCGRSWTSWRRASTPCTSPCWRRYGELALGAVVNQRSRLSCRQVVQRRHNVGRSQLGQHACVVRPWCRAWRRCCCL